MCISDLGGLGATRGNPVTYNWTPPAPLYLLHIIPWIIFVFALIRALKIEKKSWIIIIPVFISEMILLGIYITFSLLNFTIFPSRELYPFFNPLILSYAIMLLISDSLQKSGRWFRFIRVLILLSGMGFLSLYIQSIDYPSSIHDLHISYGIIIMGILSGLILYRYFSRKCFNGIRFAIIFFILNLIINTILMIIHVHIRYMQYDLDFPLIALIYILRFSFSLTLISFALFLPFLVLTLKNYYYRERLFLLLGIPCMKLEEQD